MTILDKSDLICKHINFKKQEHRRTSKISLILHCHASWWIIFFSSIRTTNSWGLWKQKLMMVMRQASIIVFQANSTEVFSIASECLIFHAGCSYITCHYSISWTILFVIPFKSSDFYVLLKHFQRSVTYVNDVC